ncbi:TfoX/Sxy family DNA transformation protein [Lonepinella sp. MS14436]|uniref:TfoX/Sxy family DNA transformation protein n=1 Tax=Lonepinella sp. MS14436 TaxID=3003619 RepID=UPI0036DBA24A
MSIHTINLHEKLSALLGEVESKKLFSGIGIFYNDHMFGIYKQGGFYLRAKDELAQYVESIGGVRWDRDGVPSNLRIRDYYLIPSDYVSDEHKNSMLIKMIKESLQQIESEKLAESLERAKRIRRLPNMSLKYERLLGKVGINTISQLREIGAADAYILIKSQGLFVTSHLFWKTFAALKNKYVELLTETEKEIAFKEINEKLAKVGFRAMKYKP